MTKRILALDLATTCGFAVDQPGGGEIPLSGSFRCNHFGDEVGDCYRDLERRVLDLIAVHAPDVLVFEAPLSRMDAAARKLFGMAAIIDLIGAREGIETWECNVGTVRSHFLGHNRFTKGEVKGAVMRRCSQLGYRFDGHDAADACALWDYAKHQLRAVDQRARFSLTPARP